MIGFLLSLLIAGQIMSPMTELATKLPVNFDFGRLKRKITASLEPLVTAESALVIDASSGSILYGKKYLESRPIASITKLMTAIVFLEAEHSFDKVIQVTEDDKENGGRAELAPGELVTVKNLFNAALIGSLNNAAYELSFATDLTYAEFIKMMNDKARAIGMEETFFYEPTGISARNKATAYDVALLLRYALGKKEIREAVNRKNYSFTALNGRSHYIENTNELLESYLGSAGGKTGYTDEAGYCLVNMTNSVDGKKEIITVVLGVENKKDRFQENKFLTQWALDNWEWE